jgi:hypothetical protein
MLFEAREIKTHALPVKHSDLQVGRVYFALQYVDDRLYFPILEPLVFVGLNLQEGDVDQAYFQHYSAYSSGIQFGSKDDEMSFEIYGPGEGNHILEYENVLDLLTGTSLRRTRAGL